MLDRLCLQSLFELRIPVRLRRGVCQTTHFTPLIILGLVAFSWTIWLTLSKHRRVALGTFVAYLAINLILELAPVSGLDLTFLRPTRFGMTVLPANTGTPLSELFSANNAPLRRIDYHEVALQAEYVVVAEPFQHGLRPTEQYVVKVKT